MKPSRKKSVLRVLFFSLMIIFLAQINLNLTIIISNFKISIGIIAFSMFLFLTPDFPIIPVTLCSAVGVFLSRVLYAWCIDGVRLSEIHNFYPESFFYLTYGILFFFFVRLLQKTNRTFQKNTAFIPLFLMDYLSNLVEVLCRVQTGAFGTATQLSILLAAVIRTLFIWLLLTGLDSYGFFLMNQEHAERYKKLLMLIAKLQSEIVWMQKNTDLVEHTMSRCYTLYNELKEESPDSAYTHSALEIAKDIHEIKKDYALIMRGISEAMSEDLNDEGMYVSEMLGLLADMQIRSAHAQGHILSLDIQCDKSIYTNKQYYLISVFNNLITNAMEASKENHTEMTITQSEQNDTLLFQITDHGSGISPDNMEEIFTPGFSTKINYDTGEVNRGLGLCLLKDIVETAFDGSVRVESRPGKTTFYIHLNKNRLEEQKV
ncbi:sensor histidine kinase [Hespellia stercorisuis]|uniref:Two-component system, sensor histidine kinase YcbA n=1 Tax=Hespellia stercorisuis DSM 15480 TaxID=1121950 RepID=A0A1M6JDN7_9FIRM|nr:ATP-binding protein [Hespellia stercorisuis]SHJ44807.1 two-component system, sensor histidine kinase YcbA [Hespellia stercorisuis DSM 15480]